MEKGEGMQVLYNCHVNAQRYRKKEKNVSRKLIFISECISLCITTVLQG